MRSRFILLGRRGAVAVAAGMLALALAPGASADLGINIQDFAFDPPVMTIHVGQSVSWTNSDSVDHTATADDGSFDTGHIGNRETSDSFTPDHAGRWTYHCAIHSSMTGTIVVDAATSPPTTTVEPGRSSSPSPFGPIAALAAGLVGLELVRRRLADSR